MSYKRIVFIALSIVTLTLVIGAAVAIRTTPTSTSVRAERPIWADALIEDYEARHGEVDGDIETMIMHGVNASCGDLVAKRNLSQVWQMNVDRGMSSDMSATTIELAVQYYCPQFKRLFTGPYQPSDSVDVPSVESDARGDQ